MLVSRQRIYFETMPSQRPTPAEQLLDEARSIEVLLTDLSPTTELIDEYWQVSVDLIGLVLRIEELVQSSAPPTDETLLRARSKLIQLERHVFELERTLSDE
jgi:hypothetical protein